jgi:transposase-like protein
LQYVAWKDHKVFVADLKQIYQASTREEAKIRRLIYTTIAIEGYNRGLLKVVKTNGSFPMPEAARKLLYLANQNMTNKWTIPLQNWANILTQLTMRFEQRFPI